MVTLDRIRLTGLLRKKPWKRGFFYVLDAALRAVRLGCAVREEMAELTALWQRRGYDLDFGAGIALGYATCGEVGFEGRSGYLRSER